MTIRKTTVFVHMLAALVLAACGGDGGGQDEVLSSVDAGILDGALPDAANDSAVEGEPSEAEADGAVQACSEGELDCACGFNDACNVGECVEGLCTACTAGERECVCGPSDTCGAGLICGSDGLCDLCEPGTENCGCDAGSCDAGLVCNNDVCAVPNCLSGSEGCPCDGGSCRDGLFCRNNMCFACNNSVSGCPCEAGVCTGANVCGDDDLCRPPLDCADLAEGEVCLPFQACDAPQGVDAFCVPETCQPGYEWIAEDPALDGGLGGGYCAELTGCTELRELGECGENQQCVIDPDTHVAQCLPACTGNYVWVVDDDGLGSCQLEPCRANSTDFNKLVECTAEFRTCFRDADDLPQCGGCKEFATEDESGACQPSFPCPEDPDDGMCGADELCNPDTGCEPLPCAEGEALGADGESCFACTNHCIFAGQTGRVWQLERDVNAQCVCETQEGYFMKSGGAAAASACDVDEDGWVTRELLVGSIQNDLAYWHNNRCRERWVDRIQLRNEYHQRLDIVTCYEAPYLRTVEAGAERPSGCYSVPLVLAEPEDLDRPGRPEFPEVEFGRPFLASELNTLTKACSNVAGDFNLDDVADVEEAQTEFVGSLAFNQDGNGLISQNANQSLWRQLAYFVELYDGFYMPAPETAEASYVIAEKSRCAQGQGATPVGGRMALDYSGIDDNDYWRGCYRGRDAAYDASEPAAGFDFGQFTCSASSGGCTVPPPPIPGGIDASLPTTEVAGTLAAHDVCSLSGAPAGAPWLGMNHHSQFQCVVLLESLPDEPERHERLKSDVRDAAFNVCSARLCDGSGDCTRALPEGASGPELPVVECTQGKERTGEAFSGDTVGWLAREFNGYADRSDKATRGAGDYQRGCIDEAAHWYGLCTSYDEDFESGSPTYRECGISMSCVGSAPQTGGSGSLRCPCNGGASSQAGCAKVWGVVDTSGSGAFYSYEVLKWDYGVWN